MFGKIMFDEKQYCQEIDSGQVFPREAKILKDALGDTMQAIADFDGIIAGGAITSVFTRKDIS